MLWWLTVSFFLFSLLTWPARHHFQGGTGYDAGNPLTVGYEKSMIGNMGYSSVQCATVPVNVGKLYVKCPYGDVGEIFGFGVNIGDDNSNNCKYDEDVHEDC